MEVVPKEEGNQSAVSASGALGMVIPQTGSSDFLTIFYKCCLAILKSGLKMIIIEKKQHHLHIPTHIFPQIPEMMRTNEGQRGPDPIIVLKGTLKGTSSLTDSYNL